MRRRLFRFVFCECFAKRDIIPVRVGLRFVEGIDGGSLVFELVNKVLLHEPVLGDVLPARLGLEVGDLGGLRDMIFSFDNGQGLIRCGEICSFMICFSGVRVCSWVVVDADAFFCDSSG